MEYQFKVTDHVDHLLVEEGGEIACLLGESVESLPNHERAGLRGKEAVRPRNLGHFSLVEHDNIPRSYFGNVIEVPTQSDNISTLLAHNRQALAL